MQDLHSKVLSFSRELQGFSQELARGVADLRRSAASKPFVGASAFRESQEELRQQTGTFGREIQELEKVTLDAISLEELLGHCSAQLEDNNKRVETLERHLREYGYDAKFKPPTRSQTLQEDGAEASPAPRLGDTWEAPQRRRSLSLPGNLSDEALGLSRADMRLPTVTPSPYSSGAPSITSISPSLRELQLKYGRASLSDSSPEVQPSKSDGLPTGQLGVDAALSSVTDVATSSPLAAQSGVPAVRGLTVNTGRRTGSLGEAPWDMLSLKAAINAAAPGTGDVGKAIGSATFHPQAAAFTSLLHMCAKHKFWEKALEVFEGMKEFHPGVVPNTVHFSSLISACGAAGQWQAAMRVFKEMKEHSNKDPRCKPNVITYSALMTACCAGGRPDEAHEAFLDMKAQGIAPDHISYSTLIAGYERWGDLEKAKALFEEMRESGLLQKGLASKLPTYLEQFNKKLMRTSSKTSLDGQDATGRASEPGHRAWNSFGSNAPSVDSPYIAAHYGGSGLSRKGSADLEDEAGGGRNELLGTRSPAPPGFSEAHHGAVFGVSAQQSFAAHALPSTPIAGNAQLLQSAARGVRPRPRGMAPSPLSQSFDGSQLAGPSGMGHVSAPPGFGSPVEVLQTPGVDPAQPSRFAADMQLGPRDVKPTQAFDAAALSQQLAKSAGIDLHLLGAIVQQQAMVQQAMTPPPSMPQEGFLPQSVRTPKAANGAPQIAEITVQEYNNLPLRFSRQLSLDQMNEAVDYFNALVEGKAGDKAGRSDGVTPHELAAHGLGSQRTTALLNCLLQLKRVRLTVRDGQQFCQLLGAE